MKKIAFILASCLMLSLTLGWAPATDHVDLLGTQDAELTVTDREVFENVLGKLWWCSSSPAGDVVLTEEVQVRLIQILLNDGSIPAVKAMTRQMGSSFSVSDGDMARLFDSLTGGPMPAEEVITGEGYLTHAGGQYTGPYATGDMAIYYPEADITGVTVAGDTMTLQGFMHISYSIDYAESFYKFEALLQKNANSVFNGYSVASLSVRELDRSVRDITASSVLAPQSGNTYVPGNAFDQNFATAWVEGESGTGVGSSITFSFDGPETVYGVSVLPGYWKNQDTYQQNGRPTDFIISFSDGSFTAMYLIGSEPEYGTAEESYEYVLFDRPVETDSVTLTITGAVAGTRFEDTCITEIQILK